MHLLKRLTLPLFLLLFQTELAALIYEDAEDGSIKRWDILPPLKDGSVSNVYDKKHKSYVIEFNGSGTRSAYILKLKSYTLPQLKILQWEMKYNEDFVIIIDVSTTQGQRYLIYTPSDNSSNYLEFGLGKAAINNHWQTYRRNLEDDLKKYEAENKILALNNFIIRGTGSIDNIKLIEEGIKKASIKTSTELKRKKDNHKKREKRLLPKIKLLGENPLILEYGQKYIEPGAVAKDINGSDLSITISHNIDIYKDGEYSVIYMTQNSIGNTAVDRRIVRVGKVNDKKKAVKEVDKEREKDDKKIENEQREKAKSSLKSLIEQPDFIKDIASELQGELEIEKQQKSTPSRSDFTPKAKEDLSGLKRSDYP